MCQYARQRRRGGGGLKIVGIPSIGGNLMLKRFKEKTGSSNDRFST